MAYEATSGIQVANHYGARDTGGSIGVERTTKSFNTLSVEFTGVSLTEDFVSSFVFPKHASIQRAFLTIDAPFAGATSVSVGEGPGPAVTNGITLTAAQLGAEGVADVTAALKGTWARGAFTTRAARLTQQVAGTPNANQGRGSLTIEYVYKVRDDTEWAPDPATFPDYPEQA